MNSGDNSSPAKLPDHSQIMALHRYFLWADRMRVHFAALLPTTTSAEDHWAHPYTAFWYAGMFVVIEGWCTLGLKDARIDEMLKSENVQHLRRFRNGTFHFQRQYFDQRFLELIGSDDSAAWVWGLRDEFSRWFLDYFDRLQQGGGR